MSGTATWYAIVDASGDLISTGTAIADSATLAAKGYTALQLAGSPAGQVWNTATKSFGPPPAPVTVLSTWQWVQRFTPAEYAAIAGSTDAQVKMFLLMLSTAATVKPADPVVQQGLAYLVSINLLTSARAAVIGAN
ncbi:hypothetical protein [Rhodopila sp.]|uniref:hypothetical protein n=1 Tax=Rhodopila sp. TaxID=2480087 RepID=UPI003D0B7049